MADPEASHVTAAERMGLTPDEVKAVGEASLLGARLTDLEHVGGDLRATAFEGLERMDRLHSGLELIRDTAKEAALGCARDIDELEHDLCALATLLGRSLGEPFKSQAAEIVSKRQTAEEGT